MAVPKKAVPKKTDPPEVEPDLDPPALQDQQEGDPPEPDFKNIRLRRSSMTLTGTDMLSFNLGGTKSLYPPLVLRCPAHYADELVQAYPRSLEITDDPANTMPEDLGLEIE